MVSVAIHLIVLLCAGIFSSSFAAGGNGDEVKNGGGLAEQYLSYALKTMPKNIELCLAQTTCAQKTHERDTLIHIKASIEQEISANILRFISEKEKPGFFSVDGFVRLAVTGNDIGSPIYYNLDLLYNKGDVRMNYGQAVQTLIHELGHHHGAKDHDALELLGSEVRRVVEGTANEAIFSPHLNENGLSALGTNTNYYSSNGALLLLFKNSAIDVSAQFYNLLSECNKDETGLDPLTAKAIQFSNLHWKYSPKSLGLEDKVLSGNVVLYCQHQYLKKYKKFYEFDLKIKVLFGKNFIYQSSALISRPKYLFTNMHDFINQ